MAIGTGIFSKRGLALNVDEVRSCGTAPVTCHRVTGHRYSVFQFLNYTRNIHIKTQTHTLIHTNTYNGKWQMASTHNKKNNNKYSHTHYILYNHFSSTQLPTDDQQQLKIFNNLVRTLETTYPFSPVNQK